MASDALVGGCPNTSLQRNLHRRYPAGGSFPTGASPPKLARVPTPDNSAGTIGGPDDQEVWLRFWGAERVSPFLEHTADDLLGVLHRLVALRGPRR
jgi:hypothetical protein